MQAYKKKYDENAVVSPRILLLDCLLSLTNEVALDSF